MKITQLGQYRILEAITTCDYDFFRILQPGTILTIERIDSNTGDVWGPPLCDWESNDLPVEPMGNAGGVVIS